MKKQIIQACVVGLGLTAAAHAVPMFGLTDDNNLLGFDTANPSVLTSAIALRTAANAPLQDLIGIDYRPSNGLLYGVGRFGAIYTIDPTTGVGSQVATLSVTLSGSRFGFDFNPVADRLRITSDADQDLRVDVSTGVATVDGTLAYAAGDTNFGRNPNVVASAYTNSFAGATSTTLYNLDSVQNVLVIQNPPNNGTLMTVGATNIDLSSLAGFDIGPGNVAYAALQQTLSGVTQLYTIDLTTGIASGASVIGGGDLLDGLTVVVPEPTGLALLGLGGLATLRRRR
jgi:hypothetical protein